MLWYKAWLETRSRFLIALVGSIALCGYRVYELDYKTPSWTLPGYYSVVFRLGQQTMVLVWLAAVTFLLMGGLLQERLNGSISFTLAMPSSRLHLMSVRLVTGLVELASLVVGPWLAMYLVASLAPVQPPVSPVLFYMLAAASGGSIFAGVAILASSTVEGTYTAPAITAGVILLCASAPRSLSGINPLDLMVSRQIPSVITEWPWAQIGAYWAIAVLLTGVSVKVVQRRDL
jgi:ABC-2 type transport system permease protein